MISIIITNYNKEKYIVKTLESCKKQLNQNFELLLADDASSDNSIKLAKTYLTKNIKINYKFLERKKKKYDNSNLSQMSLVIEAMNYCKGNYISLLDADDLFKADKIKILLDLIKQTKKKIIINSYYYRTNKGIKTNTRHFKKRKFIWPIFPPTSCITIEKKLFKKILKKISIKKFLTCYIDFRIAVYCAKYFYDDIIYVEKPLTFYRQNNDGIDYRFRKKLSYLYFKRKFEAFILNLTL